LILSTRARAAATIGTRQVIFYDDQGGIEKVFDYSAAAAAKDEKGAGGAATGSQPSKEVKCKEFTCAVSNPTGESVVLGNFDSYYTYSFNHRLETWEEIGVKHIENLYTVTSLAWKADGTRLAVGALCGTLDLYDACIRRYRYKGKFEFTYSSLSQVNRPRRVARTRARSLAARAPRDASACGPYGGAGGGRRASVAWSGRRSRVRGAP
jgi:intraflagellar transport protein 172